MDRIDVTDFGVGLRLSEPNSESDDPPVSTLRYLAPERQQDFPRVGADLDALGVTLDELVTGIPPFNQENHRELTDAIC